MREVSLHCLFFAPLGHRNHCLVTSCLILRPPGSPQPLRSSKTFLVVSFPWPQQPLRSVTAFLHFRAPLGRHHHCAISYHFISRLVRSSQPFLCSNAFFVAPLVATALAVFQYIFFVSLPLPGRHSHCVVALHVVSPPLVATTIAQRQRIFCFAPLRSHKHCAYSTHVLLFHLPWSPKPSRSVNAFFAPWSPQPPLGRHSHCVVYGRARSPNFHRVFRISRQGHRRVPPPKATGESSRTALGFFGGFR